MDGTKQNHIHADSTGYQAHFESSVGPLQHQQNKHSIHQQLMSTWSSRRYYLMPG